MKTYKLMKVMHKLIGSYNLCKFQMKLKFLLNFRQDYSFSCARKVLNQKRVVFMIDGKTIHGGLSDRLRGLCSVYHYCKLHGYEFKIYWTSPFKLEDYLTPKYPWLISEEELSFNLKDVAFRFFNTYCLSGSIKADRLYDLFPPTPEINEIHFYTNVTVREDLMGKYFNELFTLDHRVEEALLPSLNELGSVYYSISFRFVNLLGDFKDHSGFGGNTTDDEKQQYIEKGLSAIRFLHMQYPNEKILVTSDSKTFLDVANKMDYVYVAPGEVKHMDYVQSNDYNIHLKNFVDMLLILKAKLSYGYTTGKMFGNTKFARTASLLGSHDFIMLTDSDINI